MTDAVKLVSVIFLAVYGLPLAALALLVRFGSRKQTDAEAALAEARWRAGEGEPDGSDAPAHDHAPDRGRWRWQAAGWDTWAGFDAAGSADVRPDTLVEMGGCIFTAAEIAALAKQRAGYQGAAS